MPVPFSFAGIDLSHRIPEVLKAGHRWASRTAIFTEALTAPNPEGDDHVTQTLACSYCRSFIGRGRIGTDLCLRVGWSWRLAWRRLARRLGRSTIVRWRTCLWIRLRLWRLLCATVGRYPLGSPLAAGKPLLLIDLLGHQTKPRRHAGACSSHLMEPIRSFHSIFTGTTAIQSARETI
jgi:hypothetical protein